MLAASDRERVELRGGLRCRWRLSDTDYLLAAPRGIFEPGTFEVLEMICLLGPYSVYSCAPDAHGVDMPPPRVSSARIARCHLLTLANHVGRLVILRGGGNGAEAAFLGGGDDYLIHNAVLELCAMKFEVNHEGFRRVSPMNICNRGRAKKGIQITLSRSLGEMLVANANRRADFAAAIAEALAVSRSS